MVLVPGRKEALIQQREFSALKFEELWGRFEQYTHNLTSTVKVITVAPGGTLSFTGSVRWLARDAHTQDPLRRGRHRLRAGHLAPNLVFPFGALTRSAARKIVPSHPFVHKIT